MPAASRLVGLLALGLVSACTLGPDYAGPEAPVPPTWTAPLPHGGTTVSLVGWWAQFKDPVLTQLLEKAEADSPSLGQAWAAIDKARATVTSDRAEGLPALTGDASLKRARQDTMGQTVFSTTYSGGLDASWELDLWGKVRRGTEAARARLEARVSDWHDARVSLAAEVADTYVQYRACKVLARLYADEAASQNETARITRVAVTAGFTTPADGALVAAGAASATATLTQQEAECDVLVKSLAALTGLDDPTVRAMLTQGPDVLPQPAAFDVAAVPTRTLTQRPDLAALEREMAAASAEIGQAQADRLPSVSLTGSITKSGTSLEGLKLSWIVGPAVSLPIFDWGKRQAAVESARATFEQQRAKYLEALRTAIKEAEQALVRLDGATRRTGDAQAAAAGYRTYFEATDRNWRAGGASVLDREEARRNALGAETTLVTVQRDQIQQWIALYKALGGGWSPATGESP
ncbi:efflux transporter outer membrane subunit [Pararhodospirillum photometricum]|uniref:RND efflux system, outer membrane lipoprotein,NodT n=1 Tax=Pararhodospirillum photometricum DSM 122 TaxID=1150469 RepID=H6SJL8_PARPM|nr:efflux transporter outer membrane subunit [Pararhodospirillum photometricum]CCG08183.1 RND efflux system, outer membrane lipoprotein,NodT [Pararhodospirillum photometricum DSM 122]